MVQTSKQVDNYLKSLSGWQKDNLVVFRKLVHETLPNVEEEWKWAVPVFTLNGKLLCAMSMFKEHTKYNFFDGAALPDPHSLFNSGLESKRNRGINLSEGQKLDTVHLSDLVAAAGDYVSNK